MALPGNGIFVVKGEMTILITAIKRGVKWTLTRCVDDETDSLMKSFQELKDHLNRIDDLRLIEADMFLSPFLEVIRSEDTSGPVTSLALAAINKFLSYGLIDPTHSNVPQTVYNIADAVTHARFIGTDQSSDGVVLMRILQVLRTLTLAPEGASLTNESLCEIMLSCFRICFETRIHELLKKTAEHYLKDMVQLVFMRLPQFSDDISTVRVKQLKMRAGMDQTRTKKRNKHSFRKKSIEDDKDASEESTAKTQIPKPVTPVEVTSAENNVVDMQGQIIQENVEPVLEINPQEPEELNPESIQPSSEPIPTNSETVTTEGQGYESKDYVNQRGIRFTPQMQDDLILLPYGLACVRELFRFLISLCNPNDKGNSEVMIHLGLTLLTVAFEVGADSIGKHSTLLALVKDDLCRNLFSLLTTERISIFAADLQVSFLMFESLRGHLKFQMEKYLTKLIEIVVSDNQKVTYEHKEVALDNILNLWRIPGFVNELYLNYDCDMYCTNLYEDLTKLLAKNAFSATNGVWHTHLLSLDALLTVIEGIEMHCTELKSLISDAPVEARTISESSDPVENIGNLIGKNHSRIKYTNTVPDLDSLLAKKNIKKWLPQGTEHFNTKPKKGIQFFQEHGVLKPELDVNEVAIFLRENPALDKKMIGEYVSNRSNLNILEAYVKTFNFNNVRIDEALRSFLEAFRLPGEAPTISLILEQFAEHWHKSNNEPFADVDSAFTLAYAIIMLNVDQHNQNAKKQTVPMSDSAFKKNLQGVNGGGDFDESMLNEIYAAIKNDEIVMPSEHGGLIRENYLWKVLLRKGASEKGEYLHIPPGTYDSELFRIIYGPLVSALCFIYEQSEETSTYNHVIRGFEKCALVSAHFGMTKNLDMLIVSLCKFTVFYNQRRQNNIMVLLGSNQKAQLALKTVFNLAHLNGDNIREGWKHIFDLILSLYSNDLLPKCYIEPEDFIDQSGRIVLVYEETENLQKQESGLFSSIYSYMVSAENLSKIPTPEEQLYIEAAKECIKQCYLEQLITDSKFLHEEALLELVKSLIELSRGPDVQKSLGYNYNENVTVFFMELLFKIVIQNRDRVITIWQPVRDHIYTIMMNSSVFDYQFLLERSVIGLLRIAIRLMRNEDMCPIVIQSLRMLLLLKSSTLCRISKQISFGLYELLKTSAQNIHTSADWTIIFTLLECVGAGAHPPKPTITDPESSSNVVDQGTKSDGENPINSDEESVVSDRGYTSDSELTKSPKHANQRAQDHLITSPVGTPNTGGWILVGNEGEIQPVIGRTVPPTQYGIALERHLGPHDTVSLIKCCESLAFLVRDVAHITPYNFDICVHCIRTFVEASLQETKKSKKTSNSNLDAKDLKSRRKTSGRKRVNVKTSRSPATSSPDEDSSDDEFPSGYHHLLLDLMHTLHTRTAQIFKWWAEEGGEIAQETSLWTQGWCPLLQGIARMCCDRREEVRISAIAFLQRALLVHDLQTLTGPEWEQCFHRVLFPLLNYLLQPLSPKEPIVVAEFRNRAATVLSKVFLHHLTPLLSLSTFPHLWSNILDYMDRYMHADKSDILYEAIPELLKNMLLVMNSAKVFDGPDGKNQLWHGTWDRISKFLPNMKEELFKESSQEQMPEEKSQDLPYPKPINPMQHNIENLTRSSIILQPPVSQQQVSSHLFQHLGQMVSTPIGSSNSSPLPISQQHTIISTTNAAILQPTLQPGMPYMSNLLTNIGAVNNTSGISSQAQQHSFPVLYNSPTIIPNTTATEVQPLSLYAEYVGNPYNIQSDNMPRPQDVTEPSTENHFVSSSHSEIIPAKEDLISASSPDVITIDSNVTKVSVTEQAVDNSTNYFQSSNYFSSGGNGLMPVGSEILYGIDRNFETVVTTEGTSV
ncbi:Golgi-specific brefeldin A-resistance guanine nucleotide exchange factor 1 [Anthonomus grandis grandis]|uniref:Golgi-specific brefeldin A-resistance guanine nucleotide exchange factor 1 n=1 Tax=Anthonomus grandis grandis TaxID=2921223 RepID=UPI002166A715|nr:Golgi-specific brefeldin A-resistance guanine nucleotide exchange factor 1 [Anthonomus grandis grandis]